MGIARTIAVGVACTLMIGTIVPSLGCQGPVYSTGAHVDTEYDFSQVNTYALDPIREKTAHSENGKRLAAAIRAELDERGYREVQLGEAPVRISYDVGRYAPARLSGANSFAGGRGGITITVLDSATGQTVWYGWSDTLLREGGSAETAIPEAVDALFEDRLPSRAP